MISDLLSKGPGFGSRWDLRVFGSLFLNKAFVLRTATLNLSYSFKIPIGVDSKYIKKLFN